MGFNVHYSSAAHRVYVTDSILLTPEKYLYDPIIYLIGNVCVHKTSLTPS